MFFCHWDYIKKANVTSQRSQGGAEGGGGGGWGSFVLCSCKIPIGRDLEYFIFYYLDVLAEIYFRKSDRYDRDLSLSHQQKNCVIAPIYIKVRLCDSDYLSCDYWDSLYVHIAKKYAGNIQITLEIMEKNLCSFRDNTGGECGADPRDSTRIVPERNIEFMALSPNRC